MNAKTIGMIFAIFLLTIPVLACADGGSSGSGSSSGASSRVGGEDAVLQLLPDDTFPDIRDGGGRSYRRLRA